MRLLNTASCNNNISILPIGRNGENKATKVLFDKIPGLNAALSHKRNGDVAPYPVALVDEGNVLAWYVSSVDTNVVGEGSAEVVYTDGDTIVKTKVFSTVVAQALQAPTDQPPDPYEDWYINVIDARNEAEQAATNASDSASSAAMSLSAATQEATKAQAAATNAGDYAAQALKHAQDAATSEGNTEAYKNAASHSALNALSSAGNAKRSAEESESYKDLAGNYADEAKRAAEESEAAKLNTYTKQEIDKKIEDATPADYDEVKAQVQQNTSDLTEEKETLSLLEQTKADKEKLAEANAKVAELEAELAENKRVDDARWALAEGIVYRFEEDESTDYEKTVPTGAKVCTVEEIGGNSVVWNQLAPMPTEAKPLSVTIVKTEDVYTITPYVDATQYKGTKDDASLAIGHSIYLKADLKGDGTNYAIWGFYTLSSGSTSLTIRNSSSDFKTERVIGTFTSDMVAFGYRASNATPKASSVSFRNPIVIDLTAMFGTGNEPTSVDDPRIAWIEQYAEEHPQYDEGSIVHADVEKVVHGGVDHPVPTSIRNLEGYGWGVNGVYNEVDFARKKFVKRVGRVDISERTPLQVVVLSKCVDAGYSIVGKAYGYNNVLVSGFNTINKAPTVEIDDVCGRINNTYVTFGLPLDCANDMEKAKSYILSKAQYIYYELAEPIETDISDIIEPFTVETGGTLTFENPSKLPVPNKEKYLIALNEVAT